MTIREMVFARRDEIKTIAERHGAFNVRIFGSVARGDAGPESDLDLLIDAGPVVTAWFPGGLVADLEELLDRRIDVVTESALRPELRPYVMRDVVPL